MTGLDRIWVINERLRQRFPEFNSPFHIITRLMEEGGELAEQVNHFENVGIKREKHGEPDKAKLAKEVQDVIRCALQIAHHYGIEGELDASIGKSYRQVLIEMGRDEGSHDDAAGLA